MAIPEISSWTLQYKTPCWERSAVAEASLLQRDKALDIVQKFSSQDLVPRSVLFAAGLLDSPWRCKSPEMMQQTADPTIMKEPALLYSDEVPFLPEPPILLWPTLPDPEERPAKGCRLLGDYELVKSYKEATPKKDPRWKLRQRAAGMKLQAYNKALEDEGFMARCQNSVFGIVKVGARQWVKLL
jgi:hypothetical protein